MLKVMTKKEVSWRRELALTGFLRKTSKLGRDCAFSSVENQGYEVGGTVDPFTSVVKGIIGLRRRYPACAVGVSLQTPGQPYVGN